MSADTRTAVMIRARAVSHGNHYSVVMSPVLKALL